MAKSARGSARGAAAWHALECTALLLVCVTVCVTVCAGFTIHQRHPHLHPHHHLRHLRHHGHRPHPKASPESPESAAQAAQAVAVDALLEALRSADLDEAAWGSGGDDLDAGVPLFMKMLLRDTEEGAIFGEHNQPVAAAAPGAANRKTLASCVQPSRVTVGRGGAMVVEFPRNEDDAQGLDADGWWLVLSPQSRYANAVRQGDAPEATLRVYLAEPDSESGVKLLTEHRLPNASFVAVDVTRVMNGTDGGCCPRFLLDVVAPTAATGDSVSAATVLEVAGWERGPLLVRALDWGGAAGATPDAALRVWRDVPLDVLHPPRVRSRRRSRRRTTTTERPGFTSAENPLRNAAAEELQPSSAERDAEDALADEQADRQYCHLEAWTVSVDDLGWDFVVQPRTLDINFCVGRCPPLLLDAQRFNASTNAVARMAIKRERGAGAGRAGAAIPDAQCVPIRYKPIAMIMRTKGRTDLFNSYDLSADRCGCR